MKRFVFLFIGSFFLYAIIGNNSVCLSYDYFKFLEKKQKPKTIWKFELDTSLCSHKDYDSLKVMIRLWEGFVDTVYIGFANEHLIGYGHLVRKGESYGKITKWQADSLLDTDLEKIMKICYNTTGLVGRKLLAITAFSYNIGSNKFAKSTLNKKYISKNCNNGIYNEWVKWSHYHNGRKFVKSKALVKRRNWEVYFYKSET